MNDHLDANRANWDDRAGAHAARDGSGYDVTAYVRDHALISDVVRFDTPLLGDVAGLHGVHLQCHLGTDTLSLARRGAFMTGLDFSSVAVAEARRLVAETGDQVTYVESDVHDAATALGGRRFDFVFTGIGALCWLPDIRVWARTVASLLCSGGFVFVRDFHPLLLSADESRTDDVHLTFPYWEAAEPMAWDDDSTYVATNRPLTATKTYEWNHSLGEIVTALIDAGLRIDLLVEHDSVPFDGLPGQMEFDAEGGEFRLRDHPERMPLSFTVRATKIG